MPVFGLQHPMSTTIKGDNNSSITWGTEPDPNGGAPIPYFNIIWTAPAPPPTPAATAAQA